LGLDTAFPIDGYGLLFDIGTANASCGALLALAIYSNGGGTFGASFTGGVGGVELCDQSGAVSA
jgi:hypothetical protein